MAGMKELLPAVPFLVRADDGIAATVTAAQTNVTEKKRQPTRHRLESTIRDE
ncbi:hypothetical protein MJ561_13410 [Klebsiella pneumoniae]|nr:hypothetical protein MJ561_13410 [Klebsiella pneumoniae]